MAYLPTILRGADLEKSTVKSLQKELETKLGMGLSEKKNFIREQVRARISESESSPLRLSRWCDFEILSNECDAGYDGRVRVRDDVSIDTLASSSSSSSSSSCSDDDAVVRGRSIHSRGKSIFTVRTMRLVPVH